MIWDVMTLMWPPCYKYNGLLIYRDPVEHVSTYSTATANIKTQIILCSHTSRCNSRVGSRHYTDVIMNEVASQITSLTIVYSAVNSGADQRKHQSSASLAFVWGIHRWPVNSPHKGAVTQKMFPFDDVVMGKAAAGAAVLFHLYFLLLGYITINMYVTTHKNIYAWYDIFILDDGTDRRVILHVITMRSHFRGIVQCNSMSAIMRHTCPFLIYNSGMRMLLFWLKLECVKQLSNIKHAMIEAQRNQRTKFRSYRWIMLACNHLCV